MDENAVTPETAHSMDAHPMTVQDVANDVLLRWRPAPLLRDRFEVVMVMVFGTETRLDAPRRLCEKK